MATSRTQPTVGLSDPTVLRSIESQLAQAAIIANGKSTVSDGEAIFVRTTASVSASNVTLTTSANNQPEDIVTVYNSGGTTYVSAIDQTVRQTVVNQTGVYAISAGNGISISSSAAGGTGIVTISSTAGNIAVINLDGNVSNVLRGNGSWGADANSAYGNSNVVSLLNAFGSNTITTTGNVSVGNIIGNGQALTGLTGANVGGFVPNANVANTAFAVAAANVSGLGNIATLNLDGNVSNLLTGNGTYVAIPVVPTVGNIATLNLDGNSQTWLAGNGVFANIAIPSVGNIATLNLDGNVSNVLRGDGTFGADANSSYGDSNVVTLLNAFGSNTITTTGNVSVGNITGGNISIPNGNANVTGNANTVGGGATVGVRSILAIDSAFGSNDANDPASAQAVRGRVTGSNLTKTRNYVAGVTGQYLVTGTNASEFINTGLLGVVGDQTTTANAAVVAYLDGDGGLTTAGSAYGVSMKNSTPGSGFDYGLDLQFINLNVAGTTTTFKQADIRFNNGVKLVANVANTISLGASLVVNGNLTLLEGGTITNNIPPVTFNILFQYDDLIWSGNTLTFTNASSGYMLQVLALMQVGDTIILGSTSTTVTGVYTGGGAGTFTVSGTGVGQQIAQFTLPNRLTSVNGVTLTTNAKNYLFTEAGVTQSPVLTVDTLPSGQFAVAGFRAFVSDANLAPVGNFGAIVGNSGANTVCVWCDGTDWRIG